MILFRLLLLIIQNCSNRVTSFTSRLEGLFNGNTLTYLKIIAIQNAFRLDEKLSIIPRASDSNITILCLSQILNAELGLVNPSGE